MFNILIVTVRGKVKGLRHMEVKCVVKDRPPILILLPQGSNLSVRL